MTDVVGPHTVLDQVWTDHREGRVDRAEAIARIRAVRRVTEFGAGLTLDYGIPPSRYVPDGRPVDAAREC
jgi:hypothetical protein